LVFVISASHNPFDHNGIKIFGSSGFKISDETEREIERMLLDDNVGFKRRDIERPGQSMDVCEWQEEYLNHLICTWEEDSPLKGKRIVLDCANGATSAIAPDVFGRLGADVVAMENSPDGLNINEHYEYIYPESIRAAVLKEKAFAGVAFDGDGDRAMLVDERGSFVNGDVMLAILARDMKQKGLLSNNTVVSTPMSNWGLKASLEEAGIQLEETSVGDRFVLQRMIEENYALGGEQSGHIIILGDGRTTGDGIYTALTVLKAVIGQANQSLSAQASCIRELPECLLSLDVPSKPPLQTIPEVQEALIRLRTALGEHVDINLRYSGTESKLRLKIRAGEGQSQEMLESKAKEFIAIAQRAIK
jgi:phosphoglucosamine mutase